MLNTAFAKHGGLDEMLSVDETMIRILWETLCHAAYKGKTDTFGFKNWAICSSFISFYVYSGKNLSRENVFGLGGDVVVQLLNQAEVPSNSGQKLFIDNFFTSVPLLKHLAEQGY